MSLYNGSSFSRCNYLRLLGSDAGFISLALPFTAILSVKQPELELSVPVPAEAGRGKRSDRPMLLRPSISDMPLNVRRDRSASEIREFPFSACGGHLSLVCQRASVAVERDSAHVGIECNRLTNYRGRYTKSQG
jgi:hypothetical protein